MADALEKAIVGWMSKLEKIDKPCPECGGRLLRPKVLNKKTGQKMAAACIDCGYKEPIENYKTPTAEQLTLQSRKNHAIGYLQRNSIVSNTSIFNLNFKNYRHDSAAWAKAYSFAKGVANQLVQGKVIHALFIGNSGRGKSHLAMGILYDVLQRTDYGKNVAFVDWRELIDTIKTGMHDDKRDVQAYADAIMAELKAADIIVLDDLGSERDTQFNKDVCDRFWRQREDKTVITTTNLTGGELQAAYGDRTMSRMANHSKGNSYAMQGIPDYRKSEH
ncbi:ATP-binding protein [Loigolactobacillus backii]|uniref:ATP-binding protein n=1 Tax=Loigolactobacillus backii TaxID=375175 RepID=UPI0022FD5860|nr:ATP-binding protein [Loigolactobacillus backii]MDA5386497.1 ATP-binding protein [Loigolactobacillus backii]MDA5389024.1 ATP-binding protein [Loigolactobacillus backii]